MPTVKLTDGYVDSLKKDGRDQVIWDAELRRFGLRLTPTGKKIYVVQYRAKPAPGIPSTSRKVVIGEHDGRLWNVTKARALARKVLGTVDAGGDPVAERRAKAEADRLAEAEAQAAAAQAATEAEARERDRFESVTERYIAAALSARKSGHETARHLRAEPLKAWRGRVVGAIRRRDVVDLLDGIRVRSPATARLTYSALRGLFNWCVEREIVTASPCDHVKAPPRPAARDRVLADGELQAIWQGVEALGHPFGPIFKLLILTGQREAEVAGMAWPEVDVNAATWTIPKERTKNGREHVVDLSPQALEIVKAVPKSGDLLFPARQAPPRKHTRRDLATAERPVVGFSAAKRILDGDVTRKTKERLPTVGLAPWRIHDLRRTAATGMAGLGIAPHVIERVLNHVSGVTGGLVGVYQRHEYRAERRAAITAWGSRVEAITAGREQASNVLAFAVQMAGGAEARSG
jgi:integrase